MKNFKKILLYLSCVPFLCACESYRVEPTASDITCSISSVESGEGCFTIKGNIYNNYTRYDSYDGEAVLFVGESYFSLTQEYKINRKVLDVSNESFEITVNGLDKGLYYFCIKLSNGTTRSHNSYLYVSNVQTVAITSALVEGELNGVFSVSANKKVRFSKGNLRYSKTYGWYISNTQYDRVGVAENQYISSSYTGWIDLFGFGTSGYVYSPLQSSSNKSSYAYFSINDTYYDWGEYNVIRDWSKGNEGNKKGIWRTLTRDEWVYVTNRSGKSSRGRIETVNGLVLLPDEWTLPSGCSFTPKAGSFSDNTYSTSQWKKMEDAGAVFLPCCGFRIGTTVYSDNTAGCYWSSSWDATGGTSTNGNAYSAQPIYLYFDNSSFFSSGVSTGTENYYNSYGRSVRLVHDRE